MNTMTDIRGILFDYGGTLDTGARHWAHVIWEGYQKAGIKVENAEFREAYVFGERALAKAPIILPTDNFPTLLQKKLDIETQYLADHNLWQVSATERKEKSDEAARYCAEYAQRTVAESRITVQKLSEHYPLVLVSNFYGNIGTILEDYHLKEFFPIVIESAVVGIRKPDPAIFQLGVDALHLLPEEVLVVGDSFGKDILSAHSPGCRTAWMKGEGWDANEKVDEKIPDHVIYELKELETLYLL